MNHKHRISICLLKQEKSYNFETIVKTSKSMGNKKDHWENIYGTKGDSEVSWYEETPTTSLALLQSLQPKKDSAIIDIGGGNSNFTVELEKKGFLNLSVLDISAKALNRTKEKMGVRGDNVDWIASNILDFTPHQQFDIWHDRATFHFLTDKSDIDNYIQLVSNSIKVGGHLILATFSKTGPLKCSGLAITQYDKEELNNLLAANFELVKAFEDVHKTPFDTEQNFIYTLFKKR